MAKRDKKNEYELTKEKPAGSLGMLLSGAAAGSVFLFLVFLLIGAYGGLSLDNLIFYFLIAGLFGFALGGGVTWLLIRYFGEIVHFSGLVGPVASPAPAPEPLNEEAAAPEESGVVEDGKGKSVDYVFPEFSPENQS